MELFDVIIDIFEVFFETISVKKKEYRTIDYVLFFILAFVIWLLVFGKFELVTIALSVLLALLVSALLGTISNVLIKNKRKNR